VRIRDKLVIGFGAAGVALAVLAVGGAPRWAISLTALPLAIAIALTVSSRRRFASVSPIIWTLLVALGFTLLQLLPLPSSFVASLNPTGVAMRDAGLALVGQEPTDWQTITLDVAGTIRSAAQLVLMLAVAFISLRITATEKGRFWISAGVALLASLCAVITALHVVLGATTLYGVYQPYETPQFMGPLINSNHFGGLMTLGALISAGLFFHDTWVPRRIAWVVSTLFCLVASLLAQSRGAALSLLAGSIAFAVVMLGQKFTAKYVSGRWRSSADMWRTRIPIAVFATCVLALIVYSSAQNVSNQLADTRITEVGDQHSKFAAWRSAVHLLDESPWLGVGRGAIEPALTRVHPGSSFHTFSHLENEYLQAVVEWGAVGAFFIGLGLLWITYTCARRWHRGPLAAGALGALVAVAAHNAVDFNLSLPGMALVTIAITATLCYVPVIENGKRKRDRSLSDAEGGAARRYTLQVIGRVSMVIALLVSAGIMMSSMSRSLAESHRDIENPTTTYEEICQAIAAHPLDYLAYGRATDVLIAARDRRAGDFLQHAMLLHPTHAGLHRIAARVLVATGHLNQASIEYSLALRNSQRPRRLLDEVATRLVDTEIAVQAIPLDLSTPAEIVSLLSKDGHYALAQRWLEEVLATKPETPGIAPLLASLARRTKDPQAEVRAARLAYSADPSGAALLSLATLLTTNGQYTEVVTLLEKVATMELRPDDRTRGWRLRCNAMISLTHTDDARSCLRKLALSGSLPPGQLESVTIQLERLDHSTTQPSAHEVMTPEPVE
jgi:O-antigen ligase